MRDSNQTPRDAPHESDPVPPSGAIPEPFESAPEIQPFTAPPRAPLARPLILWLGLLLLFGGGGLLMGEQELALLAAFAGIYVAAHAADVDRQWRELYLWLGWIVPAMAFLSAVAVGVAIWKSSLPDFARGGLVMIAAIGAGLSLLSVPSLAADVLARALFREPKPGDVLRTTARCVVLALVLAVPGWFAAQFLLAEVMQNPGSLMEQAGLGGGLIGYVLLAFAGAGFLVRRPFVATAERLGLRPPNAVDLVMALVALGALWTLNHGADLIQHRFFPDLWEADQKMTKAIASGLTIPRAVLLGLSAGIGEEITLRGALQPKLGIPLTAAFFAALHVQYSWFGILVIFVLGTLLGIVRKRSSTTAAMLAHVVYDIIAVLGR